jgi:hypothetical protein
MLPGEKDVMTLIMRHYNTLSSVINDNKDHIKRLNSIIDKLCELTGVKNKKDLIVTVEYLTTNK